MRMLTEQERVLIENYTDTAYEKACHKARQEFGFKGERQIDFITREYHREMNRHAARLGLRVI